MIKTNRLELIASERKHLEAFAKSKADLGALLQVSIPASWPTFPEAFTIPADESTVKTTWGLYFFTHSQDKVLVGNGGFTGEPDASGIVEIGYEIASEYWNQGFATEVVQGLLAFAFADESVQAVIAHTLGMPNASNSVLKKVGMIYVSELDDDEEGKIWQWQIRKEDYQP